ncbi:MAG: LptA/OstA family protein [Desulfosudaceae bacterium]
MKHFLVVLFCSIVLLGGAPAGAEDNHGDNAPGQQNGKDAPRRVRITADRLETQDGPDSNRAEFSGHVQAVGEGFDITSDHLVVFYAREAAQTADAPLNKSFDRIIATGNVTIKAGERIAKTEKAVYDKNRKIIILTGKNATVTGEDGFISGETIIMHTDSESVTVESSAGQRVEAVIKAQPDNDNNR